MSIMLFGSSGANQQKSLAWNRWFKATESIVKRTAEVMVAKNNVEDEASNVRGIRLKNMSLHSLLLIPKRVSRNSNDRNECMSNDIFSYFGWNLRI